MQILDECVYGNKVYYLNQSRISDFYLTLRDNGFVSKKEGIVSVNGSNPLHSRHIFPQTIGNIVSQGKLNIRGYFVHVNIGSENTSVRRQADKLRSICDSF